MFIKHSPCLLVFNESTTLLIQSLWDPWLDRAHFAIRFGRLLGQLTPNPKLTFAYKATSFTGVITGQTMAVDGAWRSSHSESTQAILHLLNVETCWTLFNEQV